LPLFRDPERYFLALLSAHIEIGKQMGVAESRVLKSFAAAQHGEPLEKMEFEHRGNRIGLTDVLNMARASPTCGPREGRMIAAIERPGADVFVALRAWKRGKKGSEWHNMNAFRPLADNWRRKLNVTRAKPPSDPDWMWLDRMTAAWRVCLSGQIALARVAELLASVCGEREHFDAVMRPALAELASQRMAGLKQEDRSPDFLLNLIRETLRERG
jgi:hypothetical protein